MPTDSVLVTGACGLVGAATVRMLAEQNRHVVATDLQTPATRKVAASFSEIVDVRFANLVDPVAVETLLRQVAPRAVIHLAAVIPPLIYARRDVARNVNVGGVATLLRVAEKLPEPPRFIMASSVAVYGARNPHRTAEVLTTTTPVNPTDLYGGHKVEAETLVRNALLEWVILRLGGVVSTDPGAQSNLDNMYLERLLPEDGRVQTVDVRDVARAFVSACTADVGGQTLLIGGPDETNRLLQGDVGSAMAAAMGLVNGVPVGLAGDPDDDSAWFTTDWMDTTPAQEALGFQRNSWPAMMAEIASNSGWKRVLLRVVAPASRLVLTRMSAYYGKGLRCADPWSAVRDKWGDPSPD
ncbi:NAD(P)-dependent oxidoreductase [Mycobacterium sp. 236(2023)]|uniref:NAD-dependent epimerase/dehydratase family protein n=1 Tax=Mycobacterium sp. 236(2023) TaxID=3038163 RepID=UPI002414E9F5|nr:NAD(P)-dependent oxidoreductase [Mycobacterium sp. 236(2023)]MDG4667896.1 NAD(P)-dependent oxidoreductase [Mycobacterium sp. 236(2023)]